VDDEKPALEELKYILNQQKDLEIIGTYTNAIKALENILKEKPDIVFLDIEMPEINGFMVANEIIKANLDTFIVFATAFDEYAIKAFEINAVDYVLKPFSEERLQKTIHRIMEKYRQNQIINTKSALEQLLQNRPKNNSHKLPVWKNNRIILLKKEDILFCMAEDGEIKVVTVEDKYRVEGTLGHLEEVLPKECFFRCHRSFLVNIDAISEIIPWFNNTYIIKIKGKDIEIPVSRRHIKEFKERLHLT